MDLDMDTSEPLRLNQLSCFTLIICKQPILHLISLGLCHLTLLPEVGGLDV